MEYIQSRRQNIQEWSVVSLDLVLGLVGGLSGIIWSVLAMLFGGFESFKLDNSMIGSIYPTSPNEHSQVSNEREAKNSMMSTVANRGKYCYSYDEYMFVWLLKNLCCCFCGNSKWYQAKL